MTLQTILQAVREAVGIPVLANGNILSRADADACMAYTDAQGVLSAGVCLSDGHWDHGALQQPFTI